MTTIRQIHPKEWKYIQDHIVKEWHFERSGNGVKPVVGKYDPDNPNHVKKHNVVRINHNIIQK